MFEEHPDVPMDAIVLNIDRFHTINALNGWDFGNRVLRALGDEARAISQELNGIAGRFESDRFDIYCRQTLDRRGIYRRLQNKLTDLAPNANLRLRMGVMPWQEHLSPVQLFDRARVACSMARNEPKERMVVFNEELREREMYEQRLLSDIQRGLAGYQFELHLQPKYDIQCEPPRCIGAEALVRWQHPELGMIRPDDFIPLFEKSGQIGLLDKFVWEETARVIARWRELYGVTVPVSVNLSRVDVFDPTLEATLDDVLHKSGLRPDAFKLEITESAYTENAEQLIRVVENLRGKGYEVSMDDFGTGYSSLNMLSAMPVDVIKMDRCFVRDATHDKTDAQMIALILDIARNLGIPVVAEGVETKEQLDLLKGLGCAYAQGYYFSRPIPTPDFEAKYVRTAQADKVES
jgi:EAL domain-containing protein (putative c-di-GMP-specific phosphodiesterase class I)/GGDEF domain-containing protein